MMVVHYAKGRVTICCTDCFEPVDEIGHQTCDCEDEKHRRVCVVAVVLSAFFLAVAFVTVAMLCAGVTR